MALPFNNYLFINSKLNKLLKFRNYYFSLKNGFTIQIPYKFIFIFNSKQKSYLFNLFKLFELEKKQKTKKNQIKKNKNTNILNAIILNYIGNNGIVRLANCR